MNTPQTPDTCDRCHQLSPLLSYVGRDGYDFLCSACVVLPPSPTKNRIVHASIDLNMHTGHWTAGVLKEFAPEHGGGTQAFKEECGASMHAALDVLRGMVTLAPGARTDVTLPATYKRGTADFDPNPATNKREQAIQALEKSGDFMQARDAAEPATHVYTLLTSQRDGDTVTVYTSEAGARAALVAHVRATWKERGPKGEVMPEDADKAVNDYFDRCGWSYSLDRTAVNP